MNKYYVYVLYLDIECSQPFYVGKGSGERYRHHQSRRRQDPNKNKKQNIDFCMDAYGFVPYNILSENLSQAQSLLLEMHWISFWGRIDLGTGCLTNLSAGGGGLVGVVKPRTLSEESRAKMRSAAFNQWADPEKRERILSARKKVINRKKRAPVSEETRKKIGLASRGRKKSPETIAKLKAIPGVNLGKKFSAEWCAALSAAKKGKPSPKKGVPSGRLGIPMPEEIKKRIGAANKARHAMKRAMREQVTDG